MGNVITNQNNTLLARLKDSLATARSIKFVVSFVLESGVRLLLPDLRAAAERGANIEILTSRYLDITEPSALYLLKDALGEKADIRVHKPFNVAFHPKTYIFINDRGGEVYVGSSNLSYSALVEGVEWNYRLESSQAPPDYSKFVEEFDLLFSQGDKLTYKWLKEYSLSWKRPRWLGKHRSLQESTVQPRGAQIEALHYLRQCRQEGFTRALVVMATGVGKTYLAAFDSKDYRRVLFVAHREEILRQAAASFRDVMPNRRFGFFNATEKSTNKDVIFASVQTLSQPRYLQSYFASDHFDYIVIDEFHHVAAESYRRIVEHFRPQFLLGLTATPYRMDNQDIFRFCEDNVAYEIDLKEAINEDYLVPFHYYAVFDDTTDYREIDYRDGKYVSEQLEKALSTGRRADLIIKHYKQHSSQRALAFCSGIAHANQTAEAFQKAGIAAVAVHSGQGSLVMDRQEAMEALKAGKVKVLVTVDQFNEGVDIPEVDLVLFLRTTESYTVFLQQLGRGLRKAPDKDYLTVLDFIGNYRKAHFVPLILAGKNPLEAPETAYQIHYLANEVAEGCSLDFDLRLIDLFEEMRQHDPLPDRLIGEYFRLKHELGRRPWRLDLYEGSDLPIREFLRPRHLTPHKGYLHFLADIDELVDEERQWLGNDVEDFLVDLENTAMTKLYKIPTIRAFFQADDLLPAVTSMRVAEFLREFYKDPRLKVDMLDKSSRNFTEWDLRRWERLAITNPIRYLDRSSDFFQFDEINRQFHLAARIAKQQSPILVEHIEDILEFRKRQKVTRLYKHHEK